MGIYVSVNEMTNQQLAEVLTEFNGIEITVEDIVRVAGLRQLYRGDYESLHDALAKDEALQAVDYFNVFGFGRFNRAGYDAAVAHGCLPNEYSEGTIDPTAMAAILTGLGVPSAIPYVTHIVWG